MGYILVTGASGDIGLACVKNLAAAGHSVYCHYHTQKDAVKRLVIDLKAEYPTQDFFLIQADLNDFNNLTKLTEQLFNLDGIIFAHGSSTYHLLPDTSEDEIDFLWNTHVKSPVGICQLVQNKLAKSSLASIIFISSVYGLIGSSMEVMYSTVKGAQVAFVKAYAKEVSSLGIRVNAVAPGAVDTKMNHDWTPDETKDLLDDIPLRRMARPEEVADLSCFLISSKSTYITGTIIPLTGGWKI